MIRIPFGDLRRQYQSIKQDIDGAVQEVLESGWFVLGEQLQRFETAFAEYCGAKFAVGVGSGTEALHLALAALGIGPGDEVITAANTCVPTASAISMSRAAVVLADVDSSTMTIDPIDLERRITSRTKAVIPVHLYGRASHLSEICDLAARYAIPVIEDAAQAHGTQYKGRRIGTHGAMTCFSFYPSKNLGAAGDGGAITTNDEQYAARLKVLRNYGQRVRYFHALKGINSRLDELQAAILLRKLKYLDRWNARRRVLASIYGKRIKNPAIVLPDVDSMSEQNFHLYVIRVQSRTRFREYLAGRGVQTEIHYPIPIHLQESYRDLGYTRGEFPVSEALSEQVVSIPMYPELTEEEVTYICDIVNGFK